MPNYKQINAENLLVEKATPSLTIHYSFYDKHVMNVVDDDFVIEADNLEDMLKEMGTTTNARLAKINEFLDNQHLYKYIDIHNLAFWLKDKRLYWDRVSDSWEDPYENYFLKEKFFLEDGTVFGADNNIPGVFGQSWTIQQETDAMWRIYSKEDKTGGVDNSRIFYGVRIETTARKLLDVVYVDDFSMANLWVGIVQYMGEAEINETLKGGITNMNEALAESFFNKRTEFDHEQEFRAMMLLDSKTIEQASNYKRIAFDIPNMDSFIDSYVLDPRLSDENFDALRSKLILLGVKPEKIKQSSLYRFSPIDVKVLS